MGFADVHAFNDVEDFFFIKKDVPKGKVREGGGYWQDVVRGNERALICKKIIEKGTFYFSISPLLIIGGIIEATLLFKSFLSADQ